MDNSMENILDQQMSQEVVDKLLVHLAPRSNNLKAFEEKIIQKIRAITKIYITADIDMIVSADIWYNGIDSYLDDIEIKDKLNVALSNLCIGDNVIEPFFKLRECILASQKAHDVKKNHDESLHLEGIDDGEEARLKGEL